MLRLETVADANKCRPGNGTAKPSLVLLWELTIRDMGRAKEPGYRPLSAKNAVDVAAWRNRRHTCAGKLGSWNERPGEPCSSKEFNDTLLELAGARPTPHLAKVGSIGLGREACTNCAFPPGPAVIGARGRAKRVSVRVRRIEQHKSLLIMVPSTSCTARQREAAETNCTPRKRP
jgi:hypothetical protein